MQTPVVLLVFNRPEVTKKVFAEIRKAQPPQLFLVADGPRSEKSGEAEKCQAVRSIIEQVDWECQVYKNYSDVNLGSGLRVSSGLNWVFDTVETAIILEDDCLPHPTFFRFCDELLEKYRHDKRVMMISGTNILGEWKSNIQSYHFSYLAMIWGWASWRRSWQYFDAEMNLWKLPEMKNVVRDVLGDEKQYNRIKQGFDSIHDEEGNWDKSIWDFQFALSRFSQSGLAITPAVNLISNIGFDAEATHTKTPAAGISNLAVKPMSFPLKDPYGVGVDREYSEKHNQKFMPRSFPQKVQKKLKEIFAKKSI
ncbi:MAG: glycosyltransferase family 2 protein [Microcoleaceae cyanobacterium MO_207.B10]|nr:glycosyltransferase family 2 protein [Microcoleaceae cyanobacterium MO_207.B10]